MAIRRFSLNGDGGSDEEEPSRDDKQDVVQILHVKFEELNSLLERAEKHLKRIPIPQDVTIRYKSELADPDPQTSTGDEIHSYLGFVKFGRGWRLCYGQDHDGFPECPLVWKPVTDCSSDVRLEAVPHLTVLRDAVLAEAGKCVGALDEAIGKLSSTLADWEE
jgi:hypothetical protein